MDRGARWAAVQGVAESDSERLTLQSLLRALRTYMFSAAVCAV